MMTTGSRFYRLWWRGRCTASGAGGGACPRRHAFLDEAERKRFEALAEKSDGMRQAELRAVADDPLLHAGGEKAKKSRSDEVLLPASSST